MATLKSFTIAAALLVAGTSLAIAQNGPPTGGQPPVATAGPPGPGVIPHDVTANANRQSAVPPTGAAAGTRIADRAPHARLFMQVQRMIPGCVMGQPAAGICACGTGPNGAPSLCQTGQWCHYPAAGCTQ
jgi:hypothetical protein